MSVIVDTTLRGRILRLETDDPAFVLIIDGALHTGFSSRVDALAAARRLIP